jgi:peptidoglycan/LPS O-acetylase OafA/YrhL
MRNIRQLDSLRGIAVILVVISHWLPQTHVLNRLPIGGIGVDIFFVLSGFLISKILFDARNSEAPTGGIIKNFYIRRALRIFPIYYITIFLMHAFHEYTESNIRENFVYFLTYTSNFYFFEIGKWDGMVSHLWSLAVEEQFYLLWPFILLFVNKKYLPHVIVCFILIGTGSQIALRGNDMLDVLTWCCFDSFGMGALLAWVWTYRPSHLTRYYKYVSIAAISAFIVFCIGIPEVSWDYVPFRTLVSIMSLWAIAYIIVNRDRERLHLGFVLNNRPLIFAGKISYGLYLFHLSVPTITYMSLKPYLNPLLRGRIPLTPFYLVVNTVILLAIAVFSYYLIEKRFLNLKKYFAYDKSRVVSVELQPAAAEALTAPKEKAGI